MSFPFFKFWPHLPPLKASNPGLLCQNKKHIWILEVLPGARAQSHSRFRLLPATRISFLGSLCSQNNCSRSNDYIPRVLPRAKPGSFLETQPGCPALGGSSWPGRCLLGNYVAIREADLPRYLVPLQTTKSSPLAGHCFHRWTPVGNF